VGTSNYCLLCLNAGKIELEPTKKCDENRICVRNLGFLCEQQTTRRETERTSRDSQSGQASKQILKDFSLAEGNKQPEKRKEKAMAKTQVKEIAAPGKSRR